MASAGALVEVCGLLRGLEAPSKRTEWKLGTFVGRLAEISADASGSPMTLAFRLVLDAQRHGEPAVWIGQRESVFYPPDVAETGVDLAALPVVRAPDPTGAARAADLLARSGGFGLVLIDLGRAGRLPVPAQTRLAGLAKRHGVAVVCLTEKDEERPSIGSLVSLRAHTTGTGRSEDRFRCEALVLKDKRRGPGWKHEVVCHGPDGLH